MNTHHYHKDSGASVKAKQKLINVLGWRNAKKERKSNDKVELLLSSNTNSTCSSHLHLIVTD